MRRALATTIALILSLLPVQVTAGFSSGSAGYGDPPGWCTWFSDMWPSTVVTNDPLVVCGSKITSGSAPHAVANMCDRPMPSAG
jgi:hypothetical protein